MKNRDIQHVLKEFLSDLQNDRPIHGLESVLRRTIAYLSCRTAVKAGAFLTQDQRKELLKKLHETKNSATCPHGRPTTIRMDLPELEVLFRRRK